MAHCLLGAPLLLRTSNGALRPDAPLVCMEKWKKINTSGAPCFWCAISVFHTNGASPTSAPLVYSSGALLPWCAISINPIYSPFPSSVCYVPAKLPLSILTRTWRSMLTGPSPQASFSRRWYARSRCRGQGQEVSGPRSGKSPRVAMLGRSPLALKQSLMGKKGR